VTRTRILVPRRAVERRLGLSAAQFKASLPDLLSRQFPSPVLGVGARARYDMDAVDAWIVLQAPARVALQMLRPAPPRGARFAARSAPPPPTGAGDMRLHGLGPIGGPPIPGGGLSRTGGLG